MTRNTFQILGMQTWSGIHVKNKNVGCVVVTTVSHQYNVVRTSCTLCPVWGPFGVCEPAGVFAKDSVATDGIITKLYAGTMPHAQQRRIVNCIVRYHAFVYTTCMTSHTRLTFPLGDDNDKRKNSTVHGPRSNTIHTPTRTLLGISRKRKMRSNLWVQGPVYRNCCVIDLHDATPPPPAQEKQVASICPPSTQKLLLRKMHTRLEHLFPLHDDDNYIWNTAGYYTRDGTTLTPCRKRNNSILLLAVDESNIYRPQQITLVQERPCSRENIRDRSSAKKRESCKNGTGSKFVS